MRGASPRSVLRFGIMAGLSALVVLLGTSSASPVLASGDDYPYRGTHNVLDRWGFYTGYCVSFAAWRLSQHGVLFRNATLRGPNGQTRFFGNGGDWDRNALAVGYTVDTHPTPGAIAIWHSGEDHAWSTGHAAYVAAVDSAGNATVEEYNWTHLYGYDLRVTRAPRYIHFGGAAAGPTLSVSRYPLYHTTHAVHERAGPGFGFAVVATLPGNTGVRVVCQVRSASVVNGSPIWDRLTDGHYLTDFYVSTPAFASFSPGLARC
jgi:surface antigen